MKDISDFTQLSFLVLEDEDMEFTLLQHALKTGWTNSFSLIRVKSAEEAIDYLRKIKFHVIFLDLNVLDSKGLDTVKRITSENHHQAVIIVTTSMDDKKMAIESIQMGVQDYLIKGEYSPADLAKALLHALARSKAINKVQEKSHVPELEGIKVDLIGQKLIFSDKEKTTSHDLTPTEVKLLTHFINQFNLDVSRADIAERVLGTGVHTTDRVIDNQISRLRAKMEATPYQIISVRGVGYCLTKK